MVKDKVACTGGFDDVLLLKGGFHILIQLMHDMPDGVCWWLL